MGVTTEDWSVREDGIGEGEGEGVDSGVAVAGGSDDGSGAADDSVGGSVEAGGGDEGATEETMRDGDVPTVLLLMATASRVVE